ncbi:MAG: hypothetical protein Q9197_003708 [Variospora fuerteventurae]
MIPYPHLNAMLNPVAGPGGRKVTKDASFIPPVRAEFMLSLFDNFAGFVREVPETSGSLLLFEFFNQDKICQTSKPSDGVRRAAISTATQWARDVTDLLRREMEPAKIAGAGQSWKWQAWAGMGIMKGRMRRTGIMRVRRPPFLCSRDGWCCFADGSFAYRFFGEKSRTIFGAN